MEEVQVVNSGHYGNLLLETSLYYFRTWKTESGSGVTAKFVYTSRTLTCYYGALQQLMESNVVQKERLLVKDGE